MKGSSKFVVKNKQYQNKHDILVKQNIYIISVDELILPSSVIIEIRFRELI